MCFEYQRRIDLIFLLVIVERTDQLHIILHRSFKSIISPITDLGKNSMSQPFCRSMIFLTFIVDFKRRSRKFGQCNECAAIEVLLSARLRMRDAKIKPS